MGAYRRGSSLVELMTVIAIGSTMMATAIGLIGAAFRAESAGRKHLAQSASLARLAEQFRGDAAQAVHAESDPAAATGPLLRFHLPGSGTVEYQADKGHGIRRTRVAGEDRSREAFYCDGVARFNLADREPWQVATLWIEQRTAGGRYRIEALVGRDRRFQEEDSSE